MYLLWFFLQDAGPESVVANILAQGDLRAGEVKPCYELT
jgi:hypothetical protein